MGHDANGNLLAASAGQYRTATWWVSNLARRIGVSSTNYSEFTYGPDRLRFRQYRQRTTTDHETTLYAGGAYERLTKVNGATTTVEHTHYIRAGDQVITIAKRTGTGALWFRYPHRDHLGSIVAMTDAGGALVERSGFDPWGKRTDFSTWNPPAPNTFVPGGSGSGGTAQAVVSTTRGYTGHEHVDQLGFVHMNGRLYDAELGKFFSADPFMQFPESTQGFNRYAYAGNNPLTNWDPSGFNFFKSLLKVVGFVLMFIQPFSSAFLNGLVSGFLMSGGNLRAGLLSALTAGLMAGIGDYFSPLIRAASGAAKFGWQVAKAALEGLVGGVASIAGGGRFRDGFLGSFSSSLAGSRFKFSSHRAVAAIQMMVIGGTVSVIGGGKFGNGAATAAFAALFNELGHRYKDRDYRRSGESSVFIEEGYSPTGEDREAALDEIAELKKKIYAAKSPDELRRLFPERNIPNSAATFEVEKQMLALSVNEVAKQLAGDIGLMGIQKVAADAGEAVAQTGVGRLGRLGAWVSRVWSAMDFASDTGQLDRFKDKASNVEVACTRAGCALYVRRP